MIKMIDDTEIARLRALAEAATPAPWEAGRMDTISYTGDGQTAFKNVYVDDPRGGVHPAFGEQLPYTVARGEGDECRENAAFIAAARTALVPLLDEVVRLREVLQWYAGGQMIGVDGSTWLEFDKGELAREALRGTR